MAEVETKLSGLEDRFQIISELGSGATGTVFKAKDLLLNRIVAIKVLHTGYDSAAVTRFQREAKATSRFDHPNLVRVLDFGVDGGGKPYLVMEYLEGQDLRTVLKKDKVLSDDETLEVAKQMSSALAHAHEKGILHRDLKPSNIIVQKFDGEGRLKLVDFGLAKLLDANQSLTASGATVGTVLYISPEIVVGKPGDERSDLYSLGCVLYECLSGRPPFRGDTAHQTMLMHSQDLPKKLLRDETPSSSNLEEIIFKLLEKQPQNRFQSAAELRAKIIDVIAARRETEESEDRIDLQHELAHGGLDYKRIPVRDTSKDGADTAINKQKDLKLTATLGAIAVVALVAAGAIAFSIIGPSQNSLDGLNARVDSSAIESTATGAEGSATFSVRGSKTEEARAKEIADTVSNMPMDYLGKLSMDKRSISFSGNEPDDQLINEFKSDHFLSITLSNRLLTDKLFNALPLNTDLLKLELIDCRGFSPKMASVLPGLKLLRELRVTNCDLTSQHLLPIFRLNAIENLAVDGSKAFDSKCLNTLCLHPTLIRVQFGSTSVDAKGLKHFLKNRPRRLRNIRAAELNLHDSDVRTLDLTGIRTLTLAKNPITNRSIEYVVTFPSVNHIYLTDCRALDDGCIKSLAKLDLETLALGGTKVSKLRGLGSFKRLSVLFLDNCKAVSDESLKELVALPIAKLSLNGTAITDAGLLTLARLHPPTQKRIAVSLKHCSRITPNGRAQLAKNPRFVLDGEKFDLSDER